MTSATALSIVFVTWAAIGVVTSVVMARRGHAAFSWGVLGLILGPFALVLALDAVLREQRTAVRSINPGRAGGGEVDVLVGVDDSEESAAALDAARTLLGPRLGRLMLATVIDYDAAESGFPRAVRDEATARLERQAAALAPLDPGTMLLAGRPDEALTRATIDGDYDLLVIGRRGAGRSKSMLGSVASRLARSARVPVLLGPGNTTAVRDAAAS